jgi:hypothetical protein
VTGAPFKSACRSLIFLLLPLSLAAGERSYFVTYNHNLEEPGNLELSINPLLSFSEPAPGFIASWMEIEYGVRGWWTTELYLDGQKTMGDSTVFTGYRWENRFRPLMREHWLNPVLYFEFEDLNGADKTLLDVVGFDSKNDHAGRNDELRAEREHEIETRLILSSSLRGWNISENFLAVKNLSGEPWEFGYAVGASRPLAMAASPRACLICRENFLAGIELYGGLGDRYNPGLSGTSHYLAPSLAWELPNGLTLRVSPTWGLTQNSYRFLLRFGVSYELAGFGSRLKNFFRQP